MIISNIIALQSPLVFYIPNRMLKRILSILVYLVYLKSNKKLSTVIYDDVRSTYKIFFLEKNEIIYLMQKK